MSYRRVGEVKRKACVHLSVLEGSSGCSASSPLDVGGKAAGREAA